ncbi:MAG: serine hydrolase domain-containing protein, partial [Planctomycetota bacterium]
MTNGDITHTEDFLQRFIDSGYYPSLAVAVVRDGDVVYQGAVGVENLKTRKPATFSTPYHVASVTKAFTASLAAVLHEQGVIDLDQPAVTYLPENVRISTSPELGATITLRQLASHTSGLPRGVAAEVQSIEGRYELEPRRLYDLLANVELTSDPGAARAYSNLGFGLLGHALERAADKPLDRLMKEMICDPLKLANTAIQDDEKIQPATGYRSKSRGGVETVHSLKERLAGSGGLVTSAEDLAKFLIAQMEPGVFSTAVLDQLHTETPLSDGSGSGGALGWRVRWLEKVGPILEKNGGRSNCSAWIGFSPQHNVAVAIVTNSGGPNVDPIGRKLLTQSIPVLEERLPVDSDVVKASPFTDVRFEEEQVVVVFNGQAYRWLEVD